jgi:2-keto-4-pentenoate hydratase/2-oxohepta-3-ene-1,7-dioic acid hydratase in catechol pathway
MNNNPYQIIEWLSSTTTLQPGDLITTGRAGTREEEANVRHSDP